MKHLGKLLLLALVFTVALCFISCNRDNEDEEKSNEGSSENDENSSVSTENPESPDDPEAPGESESPEEPQEPAPKPTFSVTFLSHDGVVIITNTVTEGEKVTAPSAPSRDGYDFNGWLNLETPWNFETDTVSKDLSLTPSFVVKNYSISISLEGGSFSEELTIPSVYTIESAPIEIKDPTRVGYRFDGWAINGSSAENKNYVIENGSFGDLSLVAVWSPITYTITYENLFNAQNENPTVYDVTTGAITLSSPTRKGFTFINWLLNGTVIQEIPAGTIGDIAMDRGAWWATAHRVAKSRT